MWHGGRTGRALDLQSTGRGFKCYSGQKLCAYVTKQYNLVLDKGRWCSAAASATGMIHRGPTWGSIWGSRERFFVYTDEIWANFWPPMSKHTAAEQIETNPRHQAKNGTNGLPGENWFFRDVSLKIGTVTENPWWMVTLLMGHAVWWTVSTSGKAFVL